MKKHQTTIKLNADEILVLLNALEGYHTDHLSEEENADHDRMINRLSRALDRVD